MPKKDLLLVVSLAVASVTMAANGQQPNRKGIEFFEKKIRPVLVEHCFQCHSSSAKELGGKLRLDTKAGLLAGGESGPSIVAGEPKESLLLKALQYDGLQMPPKKRLSESVVADFTKWVQMGAPDPRTNDAVAGDKKFSGEKSSGAAEGNDVDEGKKFWSFQPIAKPAAPKVKDAKWAWAELDKFVLAKLETEKLAPASDADARTLARRLYFDLIGLPPSPEQVDAFERECGDGATAKRREACRKLVDQLLDSPQFGERWARHWLDIARYGESNGNVRNTTFPHAWRYRDYVVRAFNQDKPYDRFVTEQIAGDLLPYDSLDDRNDLLIATGFLAIGSKPNAQGNPNFQMDVVADQIEVVTTAVMALTVACARCHDHKYDPVPTRDYYSLAGIFTSTETLYGALGNTMGGAPPTALHLLAVNGKLPQLPTNEQADNSDGKKNGKKKNNTKGNGVAKNYPRDAQLAMGVRDLPKPADCRINIKGETKTLGAAVPRGFIEVCSIGESPAPSESQSGRLELARWLTSAEHPLTSRVVVNRIWHHLFGQGIVRSPDNFGLHGERPTHPELLDYLANKFVSDGWSFKKMIREIVLSRTYQMSSQFNDAAAKADPDNLLIWRHHRRRVDAEAFRDSMLAVSGKLDLTPSNGSVLSAIGEGLIQDKLTPDKIHKPSDRRSIYLCIMRGGEPEDLMIFDMADPSLIVGARNVTTVPAQGLFLMNSPFVVEQSRHFAARLFSASGSSNKEMDDKDRIDLAYRLAFQRRPTAGELQRTQAFLHDTQTAVAKDASEKATERQRLAAWATFCQSLFAANEFRYLD